MWSNRFKTVLGLTIILALALLVGGPQLQGQEPKRGGVLEIGITQQILNLDPHVATAFSSFRVMEHIYEGLLRYDSELNLQPALAESWTVSPDGKTYVFKLREGVKFHDGSVLRAEDVKYSFERILNPETKSPQRSRLELIDQIEVISPLEIKIILKEPFAPFLETMALAPGIGIVPRDFEAKVGDPKVKTLGTGPFKLAEFGPDFVSLVRHEEYWQEGLPYLDGLLIRQIPDPATLRAALRTGKIDLIFGFGVDVTAAGAFAGLRDFEVISLPELSYSLLGIQNQREAFQDVRVRQALSLAIDRQQLIEIVYFGRAAVGGPLPPAVAKWEPLPPSALPYYTPNAAAAKQLLQAAGREGLSFKIMPIPTVPDAVKIAQVIQEQLKAVGVTAEIESVDFATFLQRWRESDFDTFVSLNSGFTEPDLHLYRHVFSQGATNIFKFNDPETDRLLQEGRTTLDFGKRKQIYKDLQLRLADQVPFLFLAYADIFAIKRSDVKDFALLPTQSIVSVRETWLDR
ncbi:MAG: ABC transporter substrate-binding protein [Candidatus Bipolaricaulia bacterium]